jgi:hypothetical protein
MFFKIIFTAIALLLSTTPTVTQTVGPDFTPGRCSFDAVVSQDCDDKHIVTLFDTSPVYDGAGSQFIEQTDLIDLTDGKTLNNVVAGTELKMGFKKDSLECEYYCWFTKVSKKH